jgi:2-hydroxy-3-keto-5-methylthiopentenyl-1-phosphate phosphatase
MPTHPAFEGKQPVIFSDFDGTVTERDVIVMIMEAFAPPEWRDITDRILNQRTLSIREGVTQLFQLIPASKRPEIEAFVAREVKIRTGLDRLLAFCQTQAIPFQVLSGGVDFFIHPVLAPYRNQVAIFCNSAEFPEATSPDTPAPGIALTFPYLNESCEPCGQCGCCKISLMDRFDPATHFRIAIGDSLTDLPMARVADWTFARSKLIQYCEEEGLAFTRFETFDDVRNALMSRMAVPNHV